NYEKYGGHGARPEPVLSPCSPWLISSPPLKVRVAREFDERQPHVADEELVGAEGLGRPEADAARRGDDVVLIDPVAADPDRADEGVVLIERNAPGKNLNPVPQARKPRAARRRVVGIAQDRD